jgi:hypothetical protein
MLDMNTVSAEDLQLIILAVLLCLYSFQAISRPLYQI